MLLQSIFSFPDFSLWRNDCFLLRYEKQSIYFQAELKNEVAVKKEEISEKLHVIESQRFGNCVSELIIVVTIGSLWQVLPPSRSVISLPRVSIFACSSYKRSGEMEKCLTPFYRTGFSFPFFCLCFPSFPPFLPLLFPQLNVAETSVIHREVNPLEISCALRAGPWEVSQCRAVSSPAWHNKSHATQHEQGYILSIVCCFQDTQGMPGIPPIFYYFSL